MRNCELIKDLGRMRGAADIERQEPKASLRGMLTPKVSTNKAGWSTLHIAMNLKRPVLSWDTENRIKRMAFPNPFGLTLIFYWSFHWHATFPSLGFGLPMSYGYNLYIPCDPFLSSSPLLCLSLPLLSSPAHSRIPSLPPPARVYVSCVTMSVCACCGRGLCSQFS